MTASRTEEQLSSPLRRAYGNPSIRGNCVSSYTDSYYNSILCFGEVKNDYFEIPICMTEVYNHILGKHSGGFFIPNSRIVSSFSRIETSQYTNNSARAILYYLNSFGVSTAFKTIITSSKLEYSGTSLAVFDNVGDLLLLSTAVYPRISPFIIEKYNIYIHPKVFASTDVIEKYLSRKAITDLSNLRGFRPISIIIEDVSHRFFQFTQYNDIISVDSNCIAELVKSYIKGYNIEIL